MLTRWGLLAVCLMALNLGVTTETFAQKTKTKAPEVTQQDEALTPEAIDAILDEADAAYFTEDGVRPNYKLAFELYSQAADAGDAYAMNRVGLMYDRGEFVAQDYQEAFDWYLKAANNGHAAAQNNVGSMYRFGEGTKQDYAEAMSWFRQAAQNGYAGANAAIGDMFYSGLGVTVDKEEAVAWYQKASDGGDAGGHWSLALAYLYGDGGLGKDSQAAAELAYLAITKGSQTARDEFADIGNAETSPNFRRAIQEMLKADGYYTGSIDSSFGPATQRALDQAFGAAN